MTTTTLPGTEVAAFAAAVRGALSDLPPEELDELTDGLEADLTERAADGVDAELGDPIAYAEELRAAAGYPPRAARSHLGGTLPNLRTLSQELRRRWDALVRQPLVASVVSFFVALRPVWWVFRGGAAYALLASFLGINGLTFWPVAVAMIVFSVQVGRGRMLQRVWVRWTLRAVSAIVIVAAPAMAGWALNAWNNSISSAYSEGLSNYPQGLSYNGVLIDNIYAYDAQGQPIDRVQLFDQNGEPLNLASDPTLLWWYASDGTVLVPNADVPGRVGWNVFPLDHVNAMELENAGMLVQDVERIRAIAPFDDVKPLSSQETEIAGPTPTPTPVP